MRAVIFSLFSLFFVNFGISVMTGTPIAKAPAIPRSVSSVKTAAPTPVTAPTKTADLNSPQAQPTL